MAAANRSSAGPAPAYAAIDLGTHNCRMLIARALPNLRPRVIQSFSRSVRLGEGLSASGRLGEEAMRRAIDALATCASRMQVLSVSRSRAVATEACRRAANGAEFLDRVAATTGIVLEPISANEEAELTLAGCVGLLDRRYPFTLLFDIGGGSTEVAWVRQREPLAPKVLGVLSLPFGVVTLAERFAGRGLGGREYAAMGALIESKLRPWPHAAEIAEAVAHGKVQMLGTSGTVTTLAAVHLGLRKYDRARVDGLTLDCEDIARISRRLVAADDPGRVAVPCIGRERADLVVAGCAILAAIRRCFPVGRLTVADRGIREGILSALIAVDAAGCSLATAGDDGRRASPGGPRTDTWR